MIAEAQRRVRNNIEQFYDIPTLRECLSFVYREDKKGRPDAEQGAHDDLLFSDMLAEEASTQQKFTRDAVKKERPKKLIDIINKQNKKTGRIVNARR